MPKAKISSPMQTFMAFIFIAIICIGFVGVAYVENLYNTEKKTELLWVSDSSMEFFNKPYGGDLVFADIWFHNSCIRVKDASTYYQTNLTSVYMGNNTWVSSVPNSPTIITSGSRHAIMRFSMPNMANWLIQKININTTLNGDSDNKFSYGFDHTKPNVIEGKLSDPIYSGDAIGLTLRNANVGSLTEYESDHTLNLLQSLEIYQDANDLIYTDDCFYMSVQDVDLLYLTNWIWEYSIEIYGEKINNISIIDNLSIVIGISIAVNVIAIVYMSDKIDLGGFVKHLPKRKR